MQLNEDNRRELLSRGKSGQNYKTASLGKNRFTRRTKSRITSSVAEYNKIDMNKLFKDNILDVNIGVIGETANYTVRISFGGFVDQIRRQIQDLDSELNVRVVIRAITNSFNGDNVYVRCTCPDWQYRFAYFASVNDIIIGDPENRPSDITNPDDKLGPACKHVLLVLSNSSWIMKVASVVVNYVKYIQQHYEKLYADIIYPALYNKEFEEPVQLDLFSDDTLQSDEDELDAANKAAVERGRFQKGHTQGVRFAPKEIPEEESPLLDNEIEEPNEEA